MLLIIPFLMMKIAVFNTIQFSLILFFCSHRATRFLHEPILIRSYTFFSTSIAFVSSNYQGQCIKPVSFFGQGSPKIVLVFVSAKICKSAFVSSKINCFSCYFLFKSYDSLVILLSRSYNLINMLILVNASKPLLIKKKIKKCKNLLYLCNGYRDIT